MKIKEKFFKRLYLWAQQQYLDCRDEKPQGGFIAVTDHAVIRYFERVEGYDIEKIRQQLLSIKLGRNTKHFKDGKYSVGNLIAVVKDRTILTVYPRGRQHYDI